IYFVSNINGSPMAKDNNGFISRVRPDGAVENLKFVEGGRNGVTLNAPKGLALEGDTPWVADIDAARAFDAKAGAPIDTVSLSKLGAVFLNDIAVGLTGALYITDTGLRFDDLANVLHPGPDGVFRVGPGEGGGPGRVQRGERRDGAGVRAGRGHPEPRRYRLRRAAESPADSAIAGESRRDLAAAIAPTHPPGFMSRRRNRHSDAGG